MGQSKPEDGYDFNISDITVIADPVTLEGLPTNLPHNFVGIQLFDDAAGTSRSTASGGTFKVEVETYNNESVFEEISGSPMNAATLVTIGWDSNTRAIKITPQSITGDATHYKAVVTSNKS